MQLASRIATLRRERNQSLQDVGDAVGCSKAHIHEIEKGAADNPSMKLVIRLAKHFRVSVTSLIRD